MKWTAALVLCIAGISISQTTAAQTGLLSGTLRNVSHHTISEAAPRSSESIEGQLTSLSDDLRLAERNLAQQRAKLLVFKQQNHPLADLVEDTTQIMDLIVARYKHAIDGLRTLERLSREYSQKQTELRNWRPPANGPPWAIQQADATYLTLTESEALYEQYRQHDVMLRRSRDALLDRKEVLETRLRQSKALPGLSAGSITERQQLELESLEADRSAVDLEFLFADIFLQTNQLHESLAQITHEISQKDWQYMAGRFYFDQTAYQRVIDQLDNQIATAQKKQEQVRQESVRIINQFDQASDRLNQLLAQTPSNQSEIDSVTREVTLAGDRSKLQRMSRDVGFYRLEMLQVAKKLWEIRYDLYHGKRSGNDLKALNEIYGNLETELVQWRDYISSLINEMRRERQAFMDGAVLSPTRAEGDFLRARAAILQDRIDVSATSLSQIESTQFLLDITLMELEQFKERANLWDRLLFAVDYAGDLLSSLWHFELFTVSDTVVVEGRSITTERSVTIGKSVGALLILILGSWLVKRIMSRAMSIAMRRSKIRPSTSVIVTRWVTLLAGMTLIVFSLILVDIPLSIFAFAGGALAIGIGFGAQNLLQNLISGLMLLIEKPVRVGDWIEVGGLTGTVTSIGIRFSTLLSPTGTENLVPNSVLVQEKLINWTYSSPEVRREIQVWVDYQHDPETVRHVLMRVANDHPVVLSTPAPRVLLDSFTERGMLMKLQFWAPMLPNISGPVVMSEIRGEIHARFKACGIEFAYPHQKISLQTDSPQRDQDTEATKDAC